MGPYVPMYQGLSAADFVRSGSAGDQCFPFNVPDRLPFYRARNAIYHLFRALIASKPDLVVLAPDYNSGNEILAMRAAGATIRYCPVRRDMTLHPDDVEKHCQVYNPDLLYVIHYAGWPQPMPALVDLCRRRGMLLVEDCALSLLTELNGRPIGTFGNWSVFCLYKTLPLPNGALLVQSGPRLESLERLQLRDAGSASVLGRTAELVVQRIRSRANGLGAALQVIKRGMGRAAGALEVQRAKVGDMGFNVSDVDLAMSGLSKRLLGKLDFDEIRRRRVENFRRLAERLNPAVIKGFPDVPEGACPLFFPIIVNDKHTTAEALRARAIDAVEFWNDSCEPGGHEMGAAARFLRRHVLELPIHQDLTERHVDHVARQVNSITRGMAS